MTGQNRTRIDKNYIDFWFFTFKFGDWSLAWGANPKKPPRGHGTEFWAPCVARR